MTEPFGELRTGEEQMSTLFTLDRVAGGAMPLLPQHAAGDAAAHLLTDRLLGHAFKAVEARTLSPGSCWRATIFAGRRGQFVRGMQPSLDTILTRRRLPSGLPDEHVAVCLIHDGEFMVEPSGGQPLRFGAGQLFMLDCRQLTDVHWRRAYVSYLRLPHTFVCERLGMNPCSPGRIAVALDDSPLKPFLLAQMTLLGQQGPTLANDQRDNMLDAAIDIASSLLQAALAQPRQRPERTKNVRLLAARRYIDENLHRHDLTPAHVAQALNCSRAQLYRLFEGHAMSVGEAIKEARLVKSLRCLREEQGPVSIGEIASRCGIPDQSAFGKQFRRRFGMTPGEARRSSGSTAAEIVSGASVP